jgi:hypothetical protein
VLDFCLPDLDVQSACVRGWSKELGRNWFEWTL